MEFSEVIKNRYSCKKFDGRQVEQAQLDRILEAGRLSPTAKNLQEQRIYVVQSPEGLAKIDRVTPCRYGAPTVLAVAFNKENVFVYPGGKRDSGAEDAGDCGHAHDAGGKGCRRGKLLAEPFRSGGGGQGAGTAGQRGGRDADGIWAIPRRAPVPWKIMESAKNYQKQLCIFKNCGEEGARLQDITIHKNI